MQSPGLPAVVFEQKLIDSADKSVLFGAVVATNPGTGDRAGTKIDQAADRAPKWTCRRHAAIISTEDQTGKLELIGQIKQEVAPLKFDPPDCRPVNIADLSRTLYSLYGYLRRWRSTNQ